MSFSQRNTILFSGQSKSFIILPGGLKFHRLADIVHEFQNLVDLTSQIDREFFKQ